MAAAPFEPAKRHAQLVWSKKLGCMVTYEGPYKAQRDRKWDTPEGIGREKVRREGACRIGKESNPDCMGAWGLHRHHLVGRDRQGDDVDENIVPLCHVCHDCLHSSIFSDAIAKRIRETLHDVELRYVLQHPNGGPEWLDKTYPPASIAA